MSSNLFNKRYRLVLILSFLVVTLAIIKVTYKPEISQIQKPKIIISPTPILVVENNNDIKNYPLKEIMPYHGNSFDIEGYSAPLTLKVKIKIKDQEKITKEMTSLFEQYKLELDTHTFEWQN